MQALIFIVDLAAFALLALEHWVRRQFGPVTLDQLAFHAQVHFGSHVQSLFALDPDLTWSGVRNVLLAPAAVALAIAVLRSRLLERATHPAARKTALVVSLAVFGASCIVTPLLMDTSRASAMTSLSHEDLFGEHYVAPSQVALRAREPKNLVIVYVESLEQSYADAQAFGANLIPQATRLQQENVSLGDFVQVANTGWTMAALVSTMCGIPLKGIGLITYNRFDAFDHFLANATCLGDILREHGYRSEFLQGATLRFAGKDRFLSQHGFESLEGKEELESHGDAARDEDEWRVRDDSLIEVAKQHYAKLAAGRRPFVLGVLTSDTHTAPDAGTPSDYCARKHVVSYGELVSCTDELVSRLVAWIEAHDPEHRTAVVVIGDHLVMFGDPGDNETYQVLARKSDRRPFHLFVHPSQVTAPRAEHRRFSHFDLFPTLLAAAGFDIAGHRLGLGANLFSAEPTLLERHGKPYVDALGLQQASASYLALWDITTADGR